MGNVKPRITIQTKDDPKRKGNRCPTTTINRVKMIWLPHKPWLILQALGNGNVLVLSRPQISGLVKFLRQCGVDVDA